MIINKFNHTYQEYDCGLGKAKLNLYNGSIGLEYPLLSLGNNNFKIGTKLVYNSQYNSSLFNGKKIGFGNGWKLNLHQYIFPYLSSYNIDGFDEGDYIYIDAKWNVHKFVKYKNSNTYDDSREVYYDADGTGLKLLISNNNMAQMYDHYDNIYLFDDEGKMVEFISGINVGISKKFIYVGEYLTTIYDERKNSRQIKLNYNNDGTLQSMCTSVNKIGFNFLYEGNNLSKIQKYASNNLKDYTEFQYNSPNKLECVINSADLLALKFVYDIYNNVVTKICFGVMKKTVLSKDISSEIYVGEKLYVGENEFVNEKGKEYNGYILEMPSKYVKEEINISYTKSFTEVINDKKISIRYYFNQDGIAINSLEYKDGKLYTLSRKSGWELFTEGTSNLLLNGKKIHILNSDNNFTLTSEPKLLKSFISLFDNEDEKYSEHFNVSFLMSFKNNNISNSKVLLKYSIDGEETRKYVRLEKTNVEAWQQVIIPINLGLNQSSLDYIMLIFEGCQDNTQVQIADLKLIKGGFPETFIVKGTGEDYKELIMEIGTELYYYSNGCEVSEVISPDFYMTESDIFQTFKSLFFSKRNNKTYYDLVYNNGTKIKSVVYAGIKKNNDRFNFSIDNNDIPNYYFKLVDIVDGGTWSIMEKQICFHYDNVQLKYYYETKTMIGKIENPEDIDKRLSDENADITYTWQNADGTFRAKKDTEKIITENFYDVFGNTLSIEIFKEGNRESESIKVEYTYSEDDESQRENPNSYKKNGITTIYNYNKDNLLESIVQGNKKIIYNYNIYNEHIKNVKNEDQTKKNTAQTTDVFYSESGNIKYINDKNNSIYGFEYNLFNELENIYRDKKLIQSCKSTKNEDTLLETGIIYNDLDEKIISTTYFDTLGRISLLKHDEVYTTFNYETDDSKSQMLNRIKEINDGFSGENYVFTYDDNSEIKNEKLEIKDKISKTIYSNNRAEYVLNNNETIEFYLSKKNQLNENIFATMYMYKENNDSENKIMEDYTYTYEYDDCGRVAKRNGTMTIYDACQDCEAAAGIPCGEVGGVKLDKNISYHEGTTLPKRLTYNILSKDIHSGGEICSFYYENSHYDNGNIVNVVEGGMRYNENPKNSDLREKSTLQFRSYEYDYDAFDRLISEKNPEFGNLLYNYNKDTGMLEEIWNNGTLVKKFSYNAGYLTEVINDGKMKHISYDYYGNIINNDRASLKYNSRNLLESYEYHNTTESQYYTHSYIGKYFYNHQGVRYKKRWVEEVTGMTPQIKNINYYLSGDTILGEDWSNDNGDVTTRLRYFYDAEGICGIRYDGYNFTLVRDSIGNISKVMYKGKIIGEYLYDAWGNCVVKEISVANDRDRFILKYNPFRYKGYYCDLESGLYYCKNRYYDPNLCTWLSPDSVQFQEPESINGLNLYIYCGYNPINRYDPSGCFWDYVIDGIFIILGAIDFFKEPSWKKGGLLVLDIVLAVIPVIPAISGARHINKVDDVIDLTKSIGRIDDATDLAKTYGHIDNFTDAGGVIRKANELDFADEGWDLVQSLSKTDDGFTISSHVTGTKIHTKFMGGGMTINKLNKVDGIDKTAKIVYELKPYNKRNIKKGIKQLYRYQQAILEKTNEIYKMVLVLY